MQEDLLVVKIGGNVIDNTASLELFIEAFASIPCKKILVHGGGKLATELSTRLNIPTQMVNGRRVTDEPTLQVVTMVYAGWINKTITAKMAAHQCKAIGLSGADGSLLPAVKRPVNEIDYGQVGDIIPYDINTSLLEKLLQDAYNIVLAPITADANGNLLNVNADTVAANVAESMSKYYNTTLVYCFEKNGLLRNVEDDNSVVKEICLAEIDLLKTKGIITAGMLPKIDNAGKAIKSGVHKVIIGNAKHIIEIANKSSEYGTQIHA